RDLTRLKYIPSYQVNRGIPLWFDGALRRAVNINVGERYDSIADFMNDLETPNPEYLTEAYISQYKETLPVFKVWRILGLVWAITLFLAIAVFVL
ncbi:MAG: bifunctional protein-serine/threonine kinase/phosphatase, partial [Gammaproteobacteria bacterium]|nr:bifunctional protein-serine/threonine kinase/phosphatase [Gammaproteobacteria bacterium]